MPERNPILTAFGENLREQRQSCGLTQEVLADMADLDRTYLSDLERGLRNPGIKNVVRLAKALGIPSARLMKGIDG